MRISGDCHCEQAIKPNRIADAEILIDRDPVKSSRCVVETNAYMEIDLLRFGESQGAPAIEEVSGPLMVVLPDIFQEQVGAGCEFPFQRQGRLKS